MYRTAGAVVVVLLLAAPLLGQSGRIGVPPAPAWTFTANPVSIAAGQVAYLSFVIPTGDVHNISISGSRPTVTCGPEGCVGSLPVAPFSTTTYTLTSTNALSVPYPPLQVTLEVIPPPGRELDPAPDAVPSGALVYKEHLIYEGSFLAPLGDQGCVGCRFG